MEKPIGIRLPKEVLKQIEELGKDEMDDRSTVIRKLVMIGYKDVVRRKAAEKYMEGRITISEAARLAGMTVWEMEKYLVERGFKSDYSIEDLQKEMGILKH